MTQPRFGQGYNEEEDQVVEPAQPVPPTSPGERRRNLRRAPTLEERNTRAGADPVTHVTNLIEDKNWFTPSAFATAVVAVMYTALHVGAGVSSWVALSQPVGQARADVYSNLMPLSLLLGIVATVLWVIAHNSGFGVNARWKTKLFRNSIILLALNFFGLFGIGLLLLYVAWRVGNYLLFHRGRRGLYEQQTPRI